MHAKQDGGAVADRALVVLEPRAVRRADLDEAGSGAREHLGNPEAVADLDELTARDDNVAPFRERGNGEEDGGGVVVDDQRRLCAGEVAKQRCDVVLARAARAFLEVVLEIRVPARDLLDALEGAGRERGSAEVRVDDDSGRVENTPQPRRGRALEDVEGVGDDVLRLLARGDPLASRLDRPARGFEDQLVAVLGLQCDEPLVL